MSRPEINRRDALVCLDAGIPLEMAAELCGFDIETQQAPEPPRLTVTARVTQVCIEVLSSEHMVVEPELYAAVEATLREEGFEGTAVDPDTADKLEPFSEQDLRIQKGPPRMEPLMPLSRLWPYLHRVMGRPRPGRRLDVPRTVRLAASLRPMTRLPRRELQRWARRIRVIIDRSLPVGFIDDDAAILVEELKRLCGPHALLVEEVNEKGLPGLLALSLPTLVLSDLGQLRREKGLIDNWLEFAGRLRAVGIWPLALVPCPRDRWYPEMAAVWRSVYWDRHARLPPPGQGLGPVFDADFREKAAFRAEELIGLLSPALLVEPALVRALRCLLPAAKADIGSEYDVRMGRATAKAGRDMAVTLQAAVAGARRFETQPRALKAAAADNIWRHHAGYGPPLKSREVLNLKELGAPLPDEVVSEAEKAQQRINDTLLRDLESFDSGRRLGLFDWRGWETPRLSATARATAGAALGWVLAARFFDWDKQEIPEGMNPEHVHRAMELALPDPGRISKWLVRKRASTIELFPWEPYRPDSSEGLRTGQPLALLHARRPHIQLAIELGRRRARESIVLSPGQRAELSAGNFDKLRIESDCGAVVIGRIRAPIEKEGKTRFAWDRHGLYVELEVNHAVLRLRWIAPGVFTMGSPPDEPGRWDVEGPQHRVTIEQGFWMGATPVTQGQYLAIIGKNPSNFKNAGLDASVEQVSWDEAREFCERLTGLVSELEPGARFRLPSEAEWEYACRAGTETALYTGSITIKGEHNAPELDPIAWYGGNSGVDYQGGYDSSNWEEMQHPAKRSGTHPVAKKAPNAWGLHDMLGNVWEWCEDAWHDNYGGAPEDGSVWSAEQEGRFRVFRGGSWFTHARYCRSAFRDRFEPGDRDDSLGFRLVLARSSTGYRVPSLEQKEGGGQAPAVPRAEPGHEQGAMSETS